MVTELTGVGWHCATEVTFSVYGERGSIDVLAYRADRGLVLVVEVKPSIPEIGNLLVPIDRKMRLAPRIASERGWRLTSVARLLVVEDGRTTRRRLEEHRAIFGAAFPVRGWAVRRWLRDPDSTPGWSGLWIPSDDRHGVAATP